MKITVDTEYFSFEAEVTKLEQGILKANDKIMNFAQFVNWLGDRVLELLDKEGSSEN